jgi:hypothetical protein
VRLPFAVLLGLRLYLVCTPGVPILWALANPKMDEREVLQAMLDVESDLFAERPGLLLISEMGFASKEFQNDLAMQGIEPPPCAPSSRTTTEHIRLIRPGDPGCWSEVHEHPIPLCGAGVAGTEPEHSRDHFGIDSAVGWRCQRDTTATSS